ncbi:nitroreductase family deazaflavin-dependent oxidoreductase [Mycobacterium sp. NAZ190054]|uniref:nitroreductase family deazaflavin-dependent oxidoreductase n=1 Tax=Mycobacterium sp. NAZ190054 TaxID=1747766 RepID=UPI000797A3CA|nr:nitroreductase family deazaflavin-dependent oxidoreductase [Mycobacterium sp. NAZ190054]KWX66635.1 nitroreductase [Mycobacterium sp. NAZ190054]
MGIALWVEQNIGTRLLMLHDKLYKSTDGRIGHRIPLPGVAPSLLLHTVGAKTGKPRTNTLSYFPDGGSYYVVASKGGDPKAPGWYHNLKAHPDIEINIGPKRFAVTATPVPADDPDYPRLWKMVNDGNANRYEGYQKRTSRRIPLVRLTPKG